MKNFARDNGFDHYTINVRIDEDVENGIAEFAKSKEADAILLVTHSHSGLMKLLSSSITEGLINKGEFPIISYNDKIEEHVTH